MAKKQIPKYIRKAIRKDLKKGLKHRKVAKKYNISTSTVSEIRNETTKEVRVYKNNPFKIRMQSLPVYKRNWLWKNLCQHKQPYAIHNKCFFDEKGGIIDPERIGFLDIEATNLSADFGIMICYCIKPSDSDKIITRCLTKQQMFKSLDKALCEKALGDMYKFDRLVGHYSSKFDFPFMRTRALYHNIEFPDYGEIYQSDTWRTLRNKYKFSSNRLGNVGEFIGCETEKTKITPEHWLGALQGKKKSLDYIVDHCQKDVLILEKVYNKICRSVATARTSL